MSKQAFNPAEKSQVAINTTLVNKKPTAQPKNTPTSASADPRYNFDLSKIPISSPHRVQRTNSHDFTVQTSRKLGEEKNERSLDNNFAQPILKITPLQLQIKCKSLVSNIAALPSKSILQRDDEYKKFLPEDVERNYRQEREAIEKYSKAIKNLKNNQLDSEDRKLIEDFDPSNSYSKKEKLMLLQIELNELSGKHKGYEEIGIKSGKQGEEAVKEGLKENLMKGVNDAKDFAKKARKQKIYLGSVSDTDKKRKEKNEKNISRILNTGNWSLAANAAFIEGGKEIGAVFKLTTDIGEEAKKLLIQNRLSGDEFEKWVTEQNKNGSKALWDEENKRITVLTREICQLIDYNYKFNQKELKNEPGKKRLVASLEK